jgi:hypothetical protein
MSESCDSCLFVVTLSKDLFGVDQHIQQTFLGSFAVSNSDGYDQVAI